MNTYSLTCSEDACLSDIVKVLEERACLVQRVERIYDCYLIIYRSAVKLYGFPYEL